MPDLSEQNNHLPAKQGSVSSQITYGVAGNWIYDNVIKKIWEGFPLMISYIAGQTAWLKGLDWYWIALITLGVLFASSIILRTVFWLKDRNKSEPQETTNLLTLNNNNKLNKNDFISKIDHQAILGDLNSEHKKEIEKINANNLASFKRQDEEHKDVISAWENSEKELQAELNESIWLVEEAKEQAENIDKYIYWKNGQFLENIIEDRIYFLWFQIEVFNASIFEIVIDEKIGGKILFESQRLRSEKFIYQPPVLIKPNSRAGFIIRQELNNDEVNLINEKVSSYNNQREHFHKEMPEGYHFHSKQWLAGKITFPPEVELKFLEIRIKGSNKFPQVKTRTLTQMDDVRTSIEDFTIYV